jgi:hypothetical protein
VSQPWNRAAIVPAPREPDERLGEWWVESPWRITKGGFNLSSYERNRTYLNVPGEGFHDISRLTGADNAGDGRAVVAADLTGDGMQDLLVRQVSGGSLLLYENQFPKAGWLVVSLRGTKSNTHGIGARLTAEVGGRRIVRECYPHNGFKCQGQVDVHFGLGEAKALDRLTIRWPSGLEQVLEGVTGDRHIIVTEGDPEPRTRGR